MSIYAKHFSTRNTPQTEKIPMSSQVANSGGGFSWEVTPMDQLQRFLILGSEGGSYYASESQLTKENAMSVVALVKSDQGVQAVERIVEVSHSGRAAKNDSAIFCLALAAKLGNLETKKAAWFALPKVCRILTHLYTFCTFIESLGGWNRGLRKAVAEWFNGKSHSQLAFQGRKYAQRNGWTVEDVLRLSHAKPKDAYHDSLFALFTNRAEVTESGIQMQSLERPYKVTETGDADELQKAHGFLWACEEVKNLDPKDPKQFNRFQELVTEHRLPMEVIPTDKRTAQVYELMLENYGATALLRNMGNLTRHGILAEGSWKNNNKAISRLTDEELLRRGRIHPLNVLVALNIYRNGGGGRSKHTFTPVPDIVDAMEKAFYLSFGTIEAANKRYMLGIDVSGSMSWTEINRMTGITPRIAAAVMAMVTYRTEPMAVVKGFSHNLVDIPIRRNDTLETVHRTIDKIRMGSTNCAAPIRWALDNKVEIDTFVIYTDSETNHMGEKHPAQLIQDYRQQMGIPAKFVVCGMVANRFTVADPSDRGMLDVVGFDTATPNLLTAFSRGDF